MGMAIFVSGWIRLILRFLLSSCLLNPDNLSSDLDFSISGLEDKLLLQNGLSCGLLDEIYKGKSLVGALNDDLFYRSEGSKGRTDIILCDLTVKSVHPTLEDKLATKSFRSGSVIVFPVLKELTNLFGGAQ